MQDACGSLNFDVSAGSSFSSEEASPTLWTYEEDTEHDTNRVIWKASQPQDPALKQLMSDAYAPQTSAPRIPQTKSWSPSLSSCTIGASSSTTSCAERTTRTHRTFKRRTSSTAVLQAEAASSRSETSLDKNIQKLIALLPIVSKQADENAKREQEALREKRKKRKRVARLAERSSVAKSRRSHANVKGRQRDADPAHEEEEVTIVMEPPAIKDQLRRTEASDTMPPPSLVPLRKSWSSDGSLPLNVTQRHHLQMTTSINAGRSPEDQSFSLTSFLATSTPRPLSDVASNYTTHSHPVNEQSSKGYVEVAPLDGVSMSIPAPTTSSSVICSRLSSHVPSAIAGNKDHAPKSTPPPKQQDSRFCGPRPLVSRAQSLPKSNGPPALGMRRLAHSQAPSLSQDRPLPIKQDKFRVPFAKPKPEYQRTSVPTRPIMPSNGLHQEVACNAAATSSDVYSANSRIAGNDPTNQRRTPQVRSNQAPSVSSSTSSHVERPKVTNDCRSSPPPAEADSSMDYDMGIDLDELERVCSVYD